MKGTPLTPVPTVPTLPTISEVKVQEHSSSGATSNSGSVDMKAGSVKARSRKAIDDTKDAAKDIVDKPESEFNKPVIPRNASQPAFTTHVQGLPKNGSVPFFDRIRKTSTGERYKPSLSAIKNSRTTLNSNGDIRKSLHLRLSTSSMLGSRNNNTEMDVSMGRAGPDHGSIAKLHALSLSGRREHHLHHQQQPHRPGKARHGAATLEEGHLLQRQRPQSTRVPKPEVPSELSTERPLHTQVNAGRRHQGRRRREVGPA
jgi:hypothetical protein